MKMRTTFNMNTDKVRLYNIVESKEGTHWKLVAVMRKKRDYHERYKKIAQSQWFQEAYQGRSMEPGYGRTEPNKDRAGRTGED